MKPALTCSRFSPGGALLAACASALLPFGAAAQQYPSHSIRLICPFAAGGATDVIARIVADAMKDDFKQAVVVENITGASGGIGWMEVAKAAPDGYTLTSMANGMLAASYTVKAYANLDSRTSLSAIAYLGETPIIGYVNPSFPAKNFREFIDYVKANPGKFNYGASGGSVDLDVALFVSKAGLNIQKISYKGSTPATTAVMSNEVQFATGSPLSVRGQLEGKTIRAIGVMSGRPWPGDPSLRLAGETIPGYAMVPGWYGVMGPKGLPRAIVDKVSASARAAVNRPDNKKKLESFGVYIYDAGPEGFAEKIQQNLDAWNEGVKVTGLQPE